MSTIRVNTLQNTSTTDGGISIDNSGHVTVDGVAMPSSGPLSNRNLIINGAMQVAQRGTSSTANGYGTVDRYKASYSGGTVTQTQTAITSGDPYDEGFRYVLRLTNTTANTGTSANRVITQKIEAQNIANSGWNYTSSTSYVTLSFWARASVAQTYYVNLKTNDGTSQNYSTSFALSADTWTKVTKTIPGNSNIAFDNNSDQGFQVHFVVFRGTDSTTSGHTLDAWAAHSGSNIVPDMTNTWANTADATFDVTGVQLEVGSVATPFEHRSYGDELRRCQRYFQGYNAADATARAAISYDNYDTDTGNDLQATTLIGAGTVVDGDDARIVLSFPVTMRTRPTVTAVDIRLVTSNVLQDTTTTVQTNASSIYALTLLVDNASTMTAGQCCHLIIKGNGSLFFDAEL